MHTLVLSGLFSSDGIKETIGRVHLSDNSCEIHLWEPKISNFVHEFQNINTVQLLNGTIENGLQMDFLNLMPLSCNSNLASAIYQINAGVVIIGLETTNPEDEVFSGISFKTTDVEKIFYVLERQNKYMAAIQDSSYFWKKDAWTIAVTCSSRRPLLSIMKMDNSHEKPEIRIQFSHPKSLQDAIGEMEKLCDFLSVICGRTQFSGEVRVYDYKCKDKIWDVHLGYVRPRPQHTSVEKVSSSSVLIDPVNSNQFGEILQKWLRDDENTSTRRARHLILQGWGSGLYDVDRLVRSATAYETLMGNEGKMREKIKKHITKKAREIFENLGLDISKIAKESSCCRHYHVHGRHSLYNKDCKESDCLGKFETILRATNGLEFLFLASTMINYGWGQKESDWDKLRYSSHPFSIYLQHTISDFHIPKKVSSEAYEEMNKRISEARKYERLHIQQDLDL